MIILIIVTVMAYMYQEEVFTITEEDCFDVLKAAHFLQVH